MGYVTREGLTRALQDLREYRRTGDRFLDSLPTFLVLKRKAVAPGAPKVLTINDFEEACKGLFLVVRTGDPVATFGEQYINILGKQLLVKPSWPRGTLWTRRDNQAWDGILGGNVQAGNAVEWYLDNGYQQRLLANIGGRPLPALALAAFIFRRPSEIGQQQFRTYNDLIAKFKAFFNLSAADNALFDYSIPQHYPALGNTELERSDVIDVIAAVAPDSDLGIRLIAAQGEVNLAREIAECALRLKQVLLYGPPGTGKTYWAVKAALRLTGLADEQSAFDSGRLRIMSWHPSTTYEEFVFGVQVQDGTVTPKSGIFYDFCKEAENKGEAYVMILDEVNRANTVAVFGELLFGLEGNKRGIPFTLANGTQFSVPNNVLVIATANTADRSIAALDAALGRRFARIEVPASAAPLGTATVAGVRLHDILNALNTSVRAIFSRERCIGHSYLMDDEGKPIETLEDLIFAFRYRILPLLQDYAIDNYGVLAQVLGPLFIDSNAQEIRSEPWLSADALKAAIESLPNYRPA